MKQRSISPYAVPTQGSTASLLASENVHVLAGDSKIVESQLLGLCKEIAYHMLRRGSEGEYPAAVIQDLRIGLMKQLPDCDEVRAKSLVTLAIELLHVKIHGRFRRNVLDLSELIARADKRLRHVSDN